jgi:predicted phosphodiesterase
MISRRHFITESGLLVAGGGLAIAQTEKSTETSVPPVPAAFRMLSAPVLTAPAPDAVSVLWATSHPATGWVEYGETADLGWRATGAAHGLMPFDERCFKVRLNGLRKGTRYFYRVRAAQVDFRNAYKIIRESEVASEVHEFVTPDPSAETARFTVWNDTHENAQTLQALHAAHEKAPGDFLLWNGDITNDIYSEEKMVGQFLSPAGLPFAAKVPLHFVRGNHDVRGPAARRLERFTDVPGNEYFYWFRQGPLAGLVLDTGEDKPDSHPVYAGLNDFAEFRTAQAEWLARTIAHPDFQSAPFRVLFCHIPLWWKNETEVGSFCADGRKKWHDLLVKGRVQVAVSGHTHEAALLPPDALHPYSQLIGGGPKPAAATYIQGEVTRNRLKLTQRRLDGTAQHEVEIPG